MARTPGQVDEVWRATIVDAAMPVGALSAFAVAAVSTPLQGAAADKVLLCLLIVIVGAVGMLAGRAAAVFPSLMAAFSFDFFHVAPIRVLHLRTLISTLALLLTVAAVTGTARAISRRQEATARR